MAEIIRFETLRELAAEKKHKQVNGETVDTPPTPRNIQREHTTIPDDTSGLSLKELRWLQHWLSQECKNN